MEKNDLDISTYRDSNGLYLKIKNDWDLEEKYWEKLFVYQKIDGFLSMKIRYINDSKEYEYEITNQLTLKEYLYAGNFTIDSIVEIFRYIFMVSTKIEEYLLDASMIQMDPSLIYMEKNTGKMNFIYLGERRLDFMGGIKSILELAMDKMNPNDKKLVFFVYELYKKTKEEICTKKSLQSFLENYDKNNDFVRGQAYEVDNIELDMKQDYGKDDVNLDMKQDCEMDDVVLDMIKGHEMDDVILDMKKNYEENVYNRKTRNNREIEVKFSSTKKDIINKNIRDFLVSKDIDNKKIFKLGIICLIFIVAILLFIILYKFGIFYSSEEEGIEVGKLVGAIIFFAIVAFYGSKTVWEF